MGLNFKILKDSSLNFPIPLFCTGDIEWLMKDENM
jgi:hypothetical protein